MTKQPSLNKANITAVAKYLPEKIMTNTDLENIVDTSDEWISNRTGIKERRIVSKDQATSDMCIQAINQLLKSRGISSKELEVIIVGTVTPDTIFPSTACIIQEKIGAINAWGFDLSAACSGFLFALQTGSQFIESGRYKKILIVGADTMSSILDYSDRNTCIIFGDGAGAVLLEPSEDGFGIIDSKLRIDGKGEKFLNLKAGGSRRPTSQETLDNGYHYLYQDGRSVFKNAIRGMADISEEIIKRNGLTSKDISLFIPHQANKRIIDSVSSKLGLTTDQVLINIDRYANTTAATIPIALAEGVQNGLIKKGDLILLSAFGAGYTWGAILIKWGYQI